MTGEKAQTIVQMYEFHTMLIHRFVDGVDHQESVLQLPFEHNCMNWILGHIVTNRSHALEAVGATHDWQEAVRARYHQDTPPVTTASDAIEFSTLVKYLDQSVRLMQAALEGVPDAQLGEIHSNYRGEKSRYEHLTSFHWHEGFHLGQLDILRAFIESQR